MLINPWLFLPFETTIEEYKNSILQKYQEAIRKMKQAGEEYKQSAQKVIDMQLLEMLKNFNSNSYFTIRYIQLLKEKYNG